MSRPPKSSKSIKGGRKRESFFFFFSYLAAGWLTAWENSWKREREKSGETLTFPFRSSSSSIRFGKVLGWQKREGRRGRGENPEMAIP